MPCSTESLYHRPMAFATFLVSALLVITCGCGAPSHFTPGPQLVGLTITPSKSTMRIGQDVQLSVAAVYSDGTTRKETGMVRWESSTDSIATTTSTGFVHAVRAGTVAISVSGGGYSAKSDIAVQNAVPASISITPNSVSLSLKQSIQLSATATLNDGSVQDVTHSVQWKVADGGIIQIDGSGVVTGLKAGSASIHADLAVSGADPLSANGTATVAPASLHSLQIAARTVTMPLGTAQRLSVQGTYSDNSTADLSNSVKWASSSESVASITSVGDVSADGLGVATISASAGAVGASIDLTVASPTLMSISVSPGNGRLLTGQSVQFQAVGSYSDGSTTDLTSTATWTVADPGILLLQNGAMGVAIAAGSTQVSAALNGSSSTVPVDVRPTALVSYFSNNPGQADENLRITSGVGNEVGSCAMLYVFNQDQQMAECCGCQIPRNGLLTLSVRHHLASNPLTSIVPPAGTVMLVSGTGSAKSPSLCDPTTVAPAGSPKAWITHIVSAGKDTPAASDSELTTTELGDDLLNGLQAQCTYAQILGAGAGVCSCGVQ